MWVWVWVCVGPIDLLARLKKWVGVHSFSCLLSKYTHSPCTERPHYYNTCTNTEEQPNWLYHWLKRKWERYSDTPTFRISNWGESIFSNWLGASAINSRWSKCYIFKKNPRLIGNTCLYIPFCKTEKNVPICTIHCSFQLKSTLEAVKLWQLLFLFTRSVTYRNSFDYFLTVTCRMVCYDFKTILTSCTIWKLILLNVVVTYTASYIWVY